MPGVVRTSTMIGLGLSVVMHAGVVTWLAVDPPSMAPSDGEAWSGVEIGLKDFAAGPEPEPKTESPDARETDRSAEPAQAEPPKIEIVKVEPEPPEPLSLDEIPLGIDESDAPKDTKAFLGDRTPTEHQAPRSEVEQPALTTTPTGTSGPAVPAPAAAPSEGEKASPSELVANAEAAKEPEIPTLPAPTDPPTIETPPVEDVPTTQGEPGPSVEPVPALEGNLVGNNRPLAEALPEDVFGPLVFVMPGGGIFIMPRAEVVGREGGATPVPEVPPISPTSPPAAQPASGGVGNPRPGEVAGKESTPFTIKDTLEYKPGRTLAPEGIEVTTFDPEISVLSSMTGTLRNPVIEMRFGPDGKVKSATFKNGQSSGRADWDQPILHAMHRWTIGGRRFRGMIEANPGREVVMSVRMILTR
jgi:hypothetical protein